MKSSKLRPKSERGRNHFLFMAYQVGRVYIIHFEIAVNDNSICGFSESHAF